MADFLLRRRNKTRDASADASSTKEQSPESAQSLLSKAGGGALHGLHTVGSALNSSSRALWGTINGMAGLEGGYGNRSLLDSTGGIELSHVLGNVGLLPKNDPTKWEWMDPVRGAVDMIGDPMTYLGLGTLTKAGLAKKMLDQPLKSGLVNQIRHGERSLLSLNKPFTNRAVASVGTGDAAANGLETVGKYTGLTKASRAVGNTEVWRNGKAMFDARLLGKTHGTIQGNLVPSDASRRAAQKASDTDYMAMAMQYEKQGMVGPDNQNIIRDAVENVQLPHKRQLITPLHQKAAQKIIDRKNTIRANDTHLGIVTHDMVDDNVDHAYRKMSHNMDRGGERGTAFVGNSVEGVANRGRERDEFFKGFGGTTTIDDILMDPHAHAAIDQAAANGASIDDQVASAVQSMMTTPKYAHVPPEKLEGLARYLVDTPDVRKKGLFGNHALIDSHAHETHAINRQDWAKNVVYPSIAKELQPAYGGGTGVNVGEFLQKSQYVPGVAAQHIANISGHSVDDVLQSTIDPKVADQLLSLTPGYAIPPAETGLLKHLNDYTTTWKASTLAHPASRVRDFGSGIAHNALMGHSVPLGAGWNDARNIQHAAPLAGKYGHLPEVQDLVKRFDLTEDEAVKVLLGVEAPRSSGAVADVAPNAVGATIEDVIGNIPGTSKGGLRATFSRAVKSLRKGELDRAGNPVAEGSVLYPGNVAGVDGRTSTKFGPAAASNVLSGAGDEFNRHAGILGQVNKGWSFSAAGKRTRAAQVDYDPSTFTPFESKVLKKAMPFYSFMSRSGKNVAKELSTNPGGPMAQMIKSQDRGQAQDATIPDRIQESTSIPLGQLDDGTKRFVTNMGMMQEPTVKTLGSLMGGDLRGVGYDLLGMSHPIASKAGEYVTGQSFYRHGEPLSGLNPNIGRAMADVGVMTGLRDQDAGPITFPGSSAIENAVALSPMGRYASTLRGLTDTRKGVFTKGVNALTGIKVTDVSPKSQSHTLSRRAEDLAEANGAKVRKDVYFSKAELEALERVNPEMAAKQRALQQLMTNLTRKKKDTPK